MVTRRRSVMTLSVPPEILREFRMMVREKGETSSALFREMFEFYKKEKLKTDLGRLQEYGKRRAEALGLSESDVEHLVFGDR